MKNSTAKSTVLLSAQAGVTIEDVVNLAVSVPTNAIVLEGSPGSGKTFGTAEELRSRGYTVVRIDAQNIPQDWLVALPVIDKDDPTKVIMASHEMWKPRPKLAFIIDELYKAPKYIVDAFLPLVHGNEFMGNHYDADCIRIITSNGTAFNLGDKELPHMGNRTVRLQVRDLTVDEATRVALNLQWDARVFEWLRQTPAALTSFDETRCKDNADHDYYGYTPADPRRKFCSMRSLELVSNYMKAVGEDPAYDSATKVYIAGAIGVRAAQSFFKYLSNKNRVSLPTVNEVLAMSTEQLKSYSTFTQREIAVMLATQCTEATLDTYVDVLLNLAPEYRAVFQIYAAQKKFLQGAKSALFPRWNKLCISLAG